MTVPQSRRARPKIRLHTAKLAPDEITERDGVPVTTISRTIVDLATLLNSDHLLRVIEQADRVNALNLSAIERSVERVPRRKGTPTLRSILADYNHAPPTRSNFERDVLAFLERAGLPHPRVNTKIGELEVDLYWPRYRLVVELDGRGFHSSPRSFENDRIRDATLLRVGIRVLRITYRRFYDNPQSILEDLRALTASAA